MSDAALNALLDQLVAALASRERFYVLRLATQQATVSFTEAGAEFGRDTSGGRVQIQGLEKGGLVEFVSETRVKITPAGRAVYELVVSGLAGSGALQALVGRRLVAVEYGREADSRRVRTKLAKRALAMVVGDGDFDLLAVFPDEGSLVADLRSAIEREKVKMTFAARVAHLDT